MQPSRKPPWLGVSNDVYQDNLQAYDSNLDRLNTQLSGMNMSRPSPDYQQHPPAIHYAHKSWPRNCSAVGYHSDGSITEFMVQQRGSQTPAASVIQPMTQSVLQQHHTHHRATGGTHMQAAMPHQVLVQHQAQQRAPNYETAHANYLAQIAQATQLELILAAEAQRQHDAAVAAMHAHHCQQLATHQQQVSPGVPTKPTSHAFPVGSLEDIYCSSTSEASGPVSRSGLGLNANNGSALSLSTNATGDQDPYLSPIAAGMNVSRTVAVKKYEVIRPLGVGTYGKVKLTKYVNTNQLVSFCPLFSKSLECQGWQKCVFLQEKL